MANFFAITGSPLPAHLHGADSGISIRELAPRERHLIEDHFFAESTKLPLLSDHTAVIISNIQVSADALDDFAIFTEFALGVLTIDGFPTVLIAAYLTDSACQTAILRSSRRSGVPPRFPKKLKNSAASTWIRYCFGVRQKSRDRLHVTADRFVRFASGGNSSDALVDLCICLESLLDVNTEISFRFSVCLAHASGLSETGATYELLHELYSFRSKVVHGSDVSKDLKKIEASIAPLRSTARAILTAYILYLTEHTKEEWKKYLTNLLLN